MAMPTMAMPKQPAQDLQFAQHPPIRRYPEATFLSRLDVKLTSLLSNVPLSAIPGLTFVPFLYGHLFGAPVVALVTFPPFIFSQEPMVRIYSLVMTVAWLLVFFYTRSRKVLTNPAFIGVGVLGTVVLAVYLEGNALDTYCLYLCSWLYATVVCFLGKTYYLRARPALQRQQEQHGNVRTSQRWSFFTEEHTKWPNNVHSFPSFDSAGAACAVTTMYLQHYYEHEVPAPMWLLSILPLVWYGRIYFLAHHLVDVLAGTLVGGCCTGYVYFCRLPASMAVTSSPLLYSAQHHYDILWLVVCIVSIGMFFSIPIKGPFLAMITMSCSFIFLPITSLNSIVGTMWVGGLFWHVFERQSQDHKQWVVDTLDIFFKQFQIPPKELTGGKPYPKHLVALMEEKRKQCVCGVGVVWWCVGWQFR